MRLCVFYRKAAEYQERLGGRIEWMVCKACQRRLKAGDLFDAVIHRARLVKEGDIGPNVHCDR
jgi:hypothetical protein